MAKLIIDRYSTLNRLSRIWHSDRRKSCLPMTHLMRITTTFIATLALAFAARAGADEPKPVGVPYKNGELDAARHRRSESLYCTTHDHGRPNPALDLGHSGVPGFA